MRIAIPTQDKNGRQSIVFGHFGSAPYYAIYDDSTDELVFIENDEKKHVHGQCQPTAELTKKSVKAIICNGLGGRAINNLNSLGIKVYFGDNIETIGELLKSYKARALREFSAENACPGHAACA